MRELSPARVSTPSHVASSCSSRETEKVASRRDCATAITIIIPTPVVSDSGALRAVSTLDRSLRRTRALQFMNFLYCCTG
ncbi:hypothetical protein BOTBODRAFT_28094 [Botryobasidium botryosum FD-172 SS1]|uniref:Uncharacterized protein n=1 Tax=Botryobasidium botryosum (strain FD-172 SS1) TaxID=930990 RepID=A0A067MUT4_BOTB1|nr:hypothetical protein BOTBODRAFT_28094 [Botryobasidium botryosum FD-172 SS1]